MDGARLKFACFSKIDTNSGPGCMQIHVRWIWRILSKHDDCSWQLLEISAIRLENGFPGIHRFFKRRRPWQTASTSRKYYVRDIHAPFETPHSIDFIRWAWYQTEKDDYGFVILSSKSDLTNILAKLKDRVNDCNITKLLKECLTSNSAEEFDDDSMQRFLTVSCATMQLCC